MITPFRVAFCIATLVIATNAIAATGHPHDRHDLGKVSFPTSCDPKLQSDFDTGVALLHSFWFGRAAQTFRSVLDQDPGCAIAYWGIAIDLMGNTLGGPPSAESAQQAWTMLEKGKSVGARTARERDWIDAASAYFRNHDTIPAAKRIADYRDAMETLVRRHPDDFEAKVFYALALQAAASPSDVTYAAQRKSTALLETLYRQNPEHPGVVHFLIHGYDYPPLARNGIAAAKRYAALAPASPHARHMPSHIFTMTGMWEESIAANLSAIEVVADYYHAYDFSVYAALQLAQDAKARSMIDKAHAMARDRHVGIGNTISLAAMAARYPIERGDWAAAAALEVAASPYPQAESLTRFSRGIGMVRNGDVAGAKAELARMEPLRAALAKSDQAYWADRTDEQMRAVSAWIALAERNIDQATTLMKSAADSEDASVKHIAMENRLYPLRELYAELLLEAGRPNAALREFEAALADYPNRYRGLHGAARAADAVDDKPKAASFYAQLVRLTEKADTERPEIARAKARVAAN